MAERIRFADIARPRADDHAQLHLPIALDRPLWQHHRVIAADGAVHGLGEDDGLFGKGHVRLGRMVGIVQADGNELAHACPWHGQPSLGHNG
ncbi:hypothetical protein D3C71_1819400 [compost metagenome]